MNILAECDRRGIRIEADGDMLKVDAPKGALLPDLLALLKDHKAELLAALTQPANFDTLLTEACHGVEGIDAATFRALLSPEDIEDIEGGHIPVVTLNAYARSFAEGIRTGRITVLAAVIPKAMLTSRVRCADCRHFERDTIGDGSGIGRCKIGGDGQDQDSRHSGRTPNGSARTLRRYNKGVQRLAATVYDSQRTRVWGTEGMKPWR